MCMYTWEMIFYVILKEGLTYSPGRDEESFTILEAVALGLQSMNYDYAGLYVN